MKNILELLMITVFFLGICLAECIPVLIGCAAFEAAAYFAYPKIEGRSEA